MKQFLSERGAAFRVIDVTSDPNAAEEMVRLTNMPGVPVTRKGARVVRGFDRPALEQLLAD